MSQLNITDLEFCENQLPSQCLEKVAGGVASSKTIKSGTGKGQWSASYVATYKVSKKGIQVGIAYGIAAAISDTGEVGTGTGAGVSVG
jgi:hypothetical protein